MSVTPRGMSVQEAYREYRAGNFRVNRRYQRKLVWTIEEKQALVDSILRGYPVPLILLAYTTDNEGNKSFEILDGMQRLNAIFTFIENEYDVDGKYFDVQHLSRAKQLAFEGHFAAMTDSAKLLSAEECADIADYTFAISEYPGADSTAVHEVFGRINSYGRRLSAQERRQAGVVSSFSDLVRDLGAEIRGDVSPVTLDLSDMPSISVDVVGEMEGYGVKADSTFWCKQGVLRRSQLRDSEDEQMIADLAVSTLLNEPFAFSGKALDEYYTPSSDEAADIEQRLATYGTSRLKTEIIGTLSVLREVIASVDDEPNALRRIVLPGSANPIKTAFYAVFGAFFELCVNQRKSPENNSAILGALTDLQTKLHVAAGQIRSEPRKQNIQITAALIAEYFKDKEPPAVIHSAGAALPFENALRRSRIETGAYECKQGVLRLDSTRDEDPDLLDKVVNTICAIANIGKNCEGGIFIGVADNLSDKNRVQNLDGIAAAHVADRYVVGVDRELDHLGLDLEGYMERVVKHIASSGLSEPLRAAVLAKCDCITYRGRSVVCLWVPGQGQYSTVSDRVFVREGSSTVEVTGASAIAAVFERFVG